jgi:hypothetical protein
MILANGVRLALPTTNSEISGVVQSEEVSEGEPRAAKLADGLTHVDPSPVGRYSQHPKRDSGTPTGMNLSTG